MTAYFFLAMSSVSIIKSLQNALYLGRVGFDYRLPLVYVALAALSGPIVMFYRYLGRSYSHILLSGLTLLFLCLNLAAFYWLSSYGEDLVYLAFYLWGGIATVLLPMLGWVISYDLYTTRQAKRLFAMLGTGGILGGVAGGFYTATVAPTTGTEPLMYHVTALLGLMLGVLFCVHRLNGEHLGRRVDDRSATATPTTARLDRLTGLLKSDYFASIAVLVLMTGAVTTVIDLQYKWVLEDRFSNSEVQITQFFGVLLGTSFILSAFIQFFVTNRVLRSFGVGMGLLLLPAGILGASLGIFVLAAFWVAVGLRLTDGCLRSSIYRTSVELLFLPNWGKQTVGFKGFVDLVVFRTGDALGAALFLTAALVLEIPLTLIVGLVAIACIGWIFLARKLQEGYLGALRESLEIKSSPVSRAAFHMDEAVAEQTLLTALKSPNPSKVQLALHQLATGRWESDSPEDAFTLSGEDMMQSQVAPLAHSRPVWLKAVAPLLNHDDRRVAASALSVISRLNGRALRKKLESVMSSDSVPRSSYLLYLSEYVEKVERYLIPEQVLKWSSHSSENKAVLLAELMGSTRHPDYRALLETWAREERSPRAKAAIEALGLYVDPQLTSLFLDRLRFHWSRSSARKALACTEMRSFPS